MHGRVATIDGVVGGERNGSTCAGATERNMKATSVTIYIKTEDNRRLLPLHSIGAIDIQHNGDGKLADGTIIPRHALRDTIVSLTPCTGDWRMLWCDAFDGKVSTHHVMAWGLTIQGEIVPVAGKLADPMSAGEGYWGVCFAGATQVQGAYGAVYATEAEWRDTVEEMRRAWLSRRASPMARAA